MKNTQIKTLEDQRDKLIKETKVLWKTMDLGQTPTENLTITLDRIYEKDLEILGLSNQIFTLRRQFVVEEAREKIKSIRKKSEDALRTIDLSVVSG
jgi:hypothetical protein